MAETHQGAVAEDEIERQGGETEDHHAGQERQHIPLGTGRRGDERPGGEKPEQNDRHDVEPPNEGERAGRLGESGVGHGHPSVSPGKGRTAGRTGWRP